MLTLTKLHLVLLKRDLAHKFNISEPEISKLFTTWVKLLSNVLGILVLNPPKQVVREYLPPCFQNAKYSQVIHNIEVFLLKQRFREVGPVTIALLVIMEFMMLVIHVIL